MHELTNIQIIQINGGVTVDISYCDGENTITDRVNYQGPSMPIGDAEALKEWVKQRAIAHVDGKNIEAHVVPPEVEGLIGQTISLE